MPRGKQRIVVELYEKFFRIGFPNPLKLWDRSYANTSR